MDVEHEVNNRHFVLVAQKRQEGKRKREDQEMANLAASSPDDPDDKEVDIETQFMSELTKVQDEMIADNVGVSVQASTLEDQDLISKAGQPN